MIRIGIGFISRVSRWVWLREHLPLVITRYGEDKMVLMGIEEYRRLLMESNYGKVMREPEVEDKKEEVEEGLEF